MTISDLPRIILEEILSRLSLKSMRAVRLTCKEWNTLSKNQSFSKMQIGKEEASTKEGESQMIVLMDQKLYLMSVIFNEDPYIELKGKLISLTEQLKVKHVFNSEGLLLGIFKDNKKNIKLMVWNPYFLQPKWFEIKCFYTRKEGWDTCCYGLGYMEKKKKNSCRRSHKILRFVDICSLGYFRVELYAWYEIYDFEADLWKTLHITPLWSTKFDEFGITVKGNTYWLVTEGNANGIYIICFDFTKERFGSLMCLPYNPGIHHDVILSCVRQEKLAILLHHKLRYQHKSEIWITTEIETEKLTWSKFLTVNMGPEISSNLESFIIDEEKKLVINSYDGKIIIVGESGYFRELNLFGESDKDSDRRRYLCAYVPSLVQIKQPARGKRKKKANQGAICKKRQTQNTK